MCSLSSVTFAEYSQITSINDYTFRNANSLKSIVIPASVTSIGDCAFADATSLTTITFAENSQITSIGRGAFKDTLSLTSIFIPATVSVIESGAFEGAYLITLYAQALEEPSSWEFGWNNYDIPIIWGVKEFGTYEDIDYVVLQDNTITILGQTSKSLSTSIVIPSSINGLSVRAIGTNAFQNNTILETITIPETVVTIGEYAFRNALISKINVQASSKPDGWHYSWNIDGIEVEWSYSIE